MVEITGRTKLLGIIGDPVEHSLSPLMQNAAIAELRLDYVYVPFPVQTNNLKEALAGFTAIDLVGFNATIPHKQAIIPLLDEITPVAKAIGAVNTVWRTDKGWKGTNTDVTGLIAPLTKISRDWSNAKAVVLGNGGAARAVVAGLAQLGIPEINVVGRNKNKLAQFWQSWQDSPSISNLIKIHSWENLSGLISTCDLLVNTTPIGMSPQIDASPVSKDLMQKLSPNAIAYDLIYTPAPTKFLSLARERGATAIDGLEMLVQQGAAALQIWTDRPAPVDIMRNTLQKKLY